MFSHGFPLKSANFWAIFGGIPLSPQIQTPDPWPPLRPRTGRAPRTGGDVQIGGAIVGAEGVQPELRMNRMEKKMGGKSS